MIKIINSNDLTTDADLVCSSCGRDHTEDDYEEGIDFVFETDGDDEWCICIDCKIKFDSKDDLEKLEELNERLQRHGIDRVYTKDEFDTVLADNTPTQLMLKITLGRFRPTDKYFEFDGYNNLRSYSTIDKILEMYSDVE